MVSWPPVQQPFEIGHVLKHLSQNSKAIVAISDEPLRLGIDPRGNLELFGGQAHPVRKAGFAYRIKVFLEKQTPP